MDKETGKIYRSAFNKEDLDAGDKYEIVEKSYGGCPAWPTGAQRTTGAFDFSDF